MKHIKTYQQLNEEISMKGLAPIIASLFLTFNSLDANAFPGGGGSGARRRDAHFSQQVSKLSHKLEIDLEKLKSETGDPQLSQIIQSVQSLESGTIDLDQIGPVVDQLTQYVESNQIDDQLINDSLHHIKSGDVSQMKADYEELKAAYSQYSSEIGNSKTILIVVCTLLAIIWILLIAKGISNFRS